MKRFSLVLGVVGLGLLAAGCSSEPTSSHAPAAPRTVEAELEALYGAPFAVERARADAPEGGGSGSAHVFWMSPLADTRAIATNAVEAETAARDLVQCSGRTSARARRAPL